MSALERGLLEHDLLITSGGVSMGDFDYVKRLVDEIGLEVHFRAINIKPGKPVIFGNRGRGGHISRSFEKALLIEIPSTAHVLKRIFADPERYPMNDWR